MVLVHGVEDGHAESWRRIELFQLWDLDLWRGSPVALVFLLRKGPVLILGLHCLEEADSAVPEGV